MLKSLQIKKLYISLHHVKQITTTNMKAMKITKEQILTMNRKISREIELENNMRINHNNVHKSKKSYNRQKSKQINWD